MLQRQVFVRALFYWGIQQSRVCCQTWKHHLSSLAKVASSAGPSLWVCGPCNRTSPQFLEAQIFDVQYYIGFCSNFSQILSMKHRVAQNHTPFFSQKLHHVCWASHQHLFPDHVISSSGSDLPSPSLGELVKWIGVANGRRDSSRRRSTEATSSEGENVCRSVCRADVSSGYYSKRRFEPCGDSKILEET